MLKAFFDVSGSLNQKPNIVMAGYISTVERWEKFSDEWQAALDLPPAIKYFKVREALLLREQFDGWSRQDADARAEYFTNAATNYPIGGFAVIIPASLYLQYVRGRIPEEMDHPFYFVFLACIELVSKTIGSMGITGPVDFVFDTENLEPTARFLLEQFKRWPWKHSDIVGELDFRDDTKVLPLQSADMAAWFLRNSVDNPETEIHEYMSMNVKPPMLIASYTEEKLIGYMRRFHEQLASIDPTGELLKSLGKQEPI